MTTFFSIDVETTGTNPLMNDIASIGVVAVSEDGIILGNFYERIAYNSDLFDTDTREWWLKQNAAAKAEMFSTDGRRPACDVAADLTAFLFVHSDFTKRHDVVFVANPSTFDWGFVQRLYHHGLGITPPFSYRTLCLRSARWGRDGGAWGTSRYGNRPMIPHHALHDAQAQAFDLIELLITDPFLAT